MSKEDKSVETNPEKCNGCVYLKRFGSGDRTWATCEYPDYCIDGDRYEAMPTVVPNPAGIDDDKQRADTANHLGLMIDEMHDQLQALCKRMDKAEGTLTKGYIYPKTLPADAVIVVRTEGKLNQAANDFVGKGMGIIWPDNDCIVLPPGMSMEVYEGVNQLTICPTCKHFGVCKESIRMMVIEPDECRILSSERASNE